MATAYMIALGLFILGNIIFGIGWKKGQKSEAYGAYIWLFFGVVLDVIAGVVALIQWIVS
jgi:hypothetical protein